MFPFDDVIIEETDIKSLASWDAFEKLRSSLILFHISKMQYIIPVWTSETNSRGIDSDHSSHTHTHTHIYIYMYIYIYVNIYNDHQFAFFHFFATNRNLFPPQNAYLGYGSWWITALNSGIPWHGGQGLAIALAYIYAIGVIDQGEMDVYHPKLNKPVRRSASLMLEPPLYITHVLAITWRRKTLHTWPR